METGRFAGRRRALAYLFSVAMSVPIFGGLRSIVAPRPFDAGDHFVWPSPPQLRAMGLSEEIAELVGGFRNDLLGHSFADFAALRAWLRGAIDDEYRTQRLAVHQRCIVSHTELALLATNFPRGLVESRAGVL